MYTVWLDSAEATNTDEIGAKSAGLVRLQKLGFRTPGGFTVTVSAFWRFLQLAGLHEMVASLRLDHPSEEDLLRLRNAIANSTVPPDLYEEISQAYSRLGGDVAVRSSGLIEDGERSAFAGAYSSFLYRTGTTAVINAVRDCWSSAFSDRVASYRLQHQLQNASWLMGVIVQPMIVADKGGVMFTRDPGGDGTTLLIQAVAGGCERIVAGESADMTVRVDVSSPSGWRIEQAQRTPRRFGSGAAGLLDSPTGPTPHLLRNREIVALIDAGLAIEAAFGMPQDIEWVIVDGHLVLLQARPIVGSAKDSDPERR